MKDEDKVSDQVIFDNLDQPNKNGRVYTTECMSKAIENLTGKELYGTFGMPAEFEMKEVSHIVTDIRIEGDKMIGKIKILDTPRGKALQEMDQSQVAYRSAGTGTLTTDDQGRTIVTDYTLLYINVIPKDTAA